MTLTMEHAPLTTMRAKLRSLAMTPDEPRRDVPVSRIGNAAYALEKSSMALLWASTPTAKAIAQREYDAACADMLALLMQRPAIQSNIEDAA